MPGAKVALLKVAFRVEIDRYVGCTSRRWRGGRRDDSARFPTQVALLGSVRDLARVLLRLDSNDAPFSGGKVPPGYMIKVAYCGG